MSCCCFTWIVFIELNFAVAFRLIPKTWDDQVLPVRRMKSCWGDDFNMGGGGIETPLQTMDPNYIFAQQMAFTFLHALNSFNNQE